MDRESWLSQVKKLDRLTYDDTDQPKTRLGTLVDHARFEKSPPRTFKLRYPKIGYWKTNEPKVSSRAIKCKLTFDRLMSKYTKQSFNSMNRLIKKGSGHF